MKKIILIMGVCGSGKSTIANLLSEKLNIPVLEGDSFHTPENKQKMNQGIALTDDDRIPWLTSLNSEIKSQTTSVIVACSALKESYREILFSGVQNKKIILLHSTKEILSQRLSDRKDHFMNPNLLESQLEILEKPIECHEIDCSKNPAAQVEEILALL